MKNFTIIGVRLFSLFVLLQILGVLQLIPSIIFDQYFSLSDIFEVGIILVVYLAIFIVLYFRAPKIASVITPKTNDVEIKIDDYEKLSAILFSSVGLLIIYWGFESLLQNIGTTINMNAMYPDHSQLTNQKIWVFILGSIAKLVAGSFLFVGGKNISKWWNDFRNWT